MNKILTIALAAVGLAFVPTPEVNAAAPVAPVTQSGPTVLPGVVHQAPVVIVERRHRRYRYVRRAYWYHGRRRYRSVRIFL